MNCPWTQVLSSNLMNGPYFEGIDIRSLLFLLYVVPLLQTSYEYGFTCTSIIPSPCLSGSHTRSPGDNVSNSLCGVGQNSSFVLALGTARYP